MLNLKPIVHAILEDCALPRHGTHGGVWTDRIGNAVIVRFAANRCMMK